MELASSVASYRGSAGVHFRAIVLYAAPGGIGGMVWRQDFTLPGRYPDWQAAAAAAKRYAARERIDCCLGLYDGAPCRSVNAGAIQ